MNDEPRKHKATFELNPWPVCAGCGASSSPYPPPNWKCAKCGDINNYIEKRLHPFPSVTTNSDRPNAQPKFYKGDHVVLVPCDRIDARVTDIHFYRDGIEYDVRYFSNGEPKVVRCFEDELEPKG